VGFSIFDERVAIQPAATFESADGVINETIIQGSRNGVRLDSLQATNSDAIDHELGFQLNASGYAVEMGTVNIPAGAGFGGVPPVDIMAAIAPTQIGGIIITKDWSFVVENLVAVVFPNKVSVWAFGGEF
jgi:hypothetical protein